MIVILAFWTVFTPPALIIALLGGAATGWLLGMLFPPNPLVHGSRLLVAFGVIGFTGIVFFAGQTVEVALGEEGHLWPRLAARAVLWVIFSAALAVAGTWAQRTRWKH